MILSIISDIIIGIRDSCNILYLLTYLYDKHQFRTIILKIIKYNFYFHILPFVFLKLIPETKVIMLTFLTYLIYFLNLFSVLFHLICHIDLVDTLSSFKPKTTSNMSFLDLLSTTIIFTIYQSIIYLFFMIIDILLNDRLYVIIIFFKIIILSMYHSLYCYNNLWQFHRVDLFQRINIFECNWPYFLGFGLFCSIIYYNIADTYWLFIYNLYLNIIICLPFLLDRRWPQKETYSKINLIPLYYLFNQSMVFIREWIYFVKKLELWN